MGLSTCSLSQPAKGEAKLPNPQTPPNPVVGWCRGAAVEHVRLRDTNKPQLFAFLEGRGFKKVWSCVFESKLLLSDVCCVWRVNVSKSWDSGFGQNRKHCREPCCAVFSARCGFSPCCFCSHQRAPTSPALPKRMCCLATVVSRGGRLAALNQQAQNHLQSTMKNYGCLRKAVNRRTMPTLVYRQP